MVRKVDNERSEAIELIKILDRAARENTLAVKSVGGESTLNTGKTRMFPDILLYGDESRTQILQGWEIKMPDTPVTNSDFIYDAQRKASTLGLSSCVLWNFSNAVLYALNEVNDWIVVNEWDINSRIRKRSDVSVFREEWESASTTVFIEINEYFRTGAIAPSGLGDIVARTIFSKIVNRNQNLVAGFVQEVCLADASRRAFISSWWRENKDEYAFDTNNEFEAYARILLQNWLNKFTFAHLIKRNHDPASLVETINCEVAPSDALRIFEEISSKCDFHNVFLTLEMGDAIPSVSWMDLVDFNLFLSESGVVNLDQATLQHVLENCVNEFRRSISGFYTTPPLLALLLARIGVNNLNEFSIDPCCGTGTIVNEIISLKECSVGIEKAMKTTFASDKNLLPLQISNLSMTRPESINLPTMLFQENAFTLREGEEITIVDPEGGQEVMLELPKWNSIVSNLPFVKFDQEGREDVRLMEAVSEKVFMETGIQLSGRGDVYQQLLLSFHSILDSGSSCTVITSNSWLGTIAGDQFFKALGYYYDIEDVISSGSGRWFRNADVVATIIHLKKKDRVREPLPSDVTHFWLLKCPLERMDIEQIEVITDKIKLKDCTENDLSVGHSYTAKEIREYRELNIGYNPLFVNPWWLKRVSSMLVPVSESFSVFRGMKTAQNEIYYLTDNTVVDKEHITRALKSLKSCKVLKPGADMDVLSCSLTKEELQKAGHNQTLEWIQRFEGNLNKSMPSKDSFWMNVGTGVFSGSTPIRLFSGMNPDRRIFFGLMDEPALIDQRAIGFNPLSSSVDLELCHALLNSALGIFYVEAVGFPKALNALDNNATNTRRMMMLNPAMVNKSQREEIFEAFEPLLSREIESTNEEFNREDRLTFERKVAEVYGYSDYLEEIIATINQIQLIRQSARKS